jgi:hypothetical protein
MRTIETSALTLDQIDNLLSGTIMVFDNAGNNSIIIDIGQVFHEKSDGDTQYFDELAKLITFGADDTFLIIEEE